MNKRTGEVNDFTVHSATSAAHGLWFRGGGFTTMGYAAHNALADADLSVSAYKLFHKMCALQNRKDHGLVLVESQVKFAEQVDMSQASVSRALKQLAAQGFIYPEGRNWRLLPTSSSTATERRRDRLCRAFPPALLTRTPGGVPT
ncbi:hypothetical protein ACFV1R_13635 [Streptomyces coelicoflavus]|uniref:hypothetical protein n=1 Tax=Streptomyces coelicoflavus TaxID=285562 RepID=UPI00367C3F3A